MLTSLENGLGLDIVIWLQNHGNGLFDILAEFLNIFGGSMFVLIVGPLIYWSLNKRTGQHMVVLLLTGALVSTVSKQLINSPRPFVAHPDQVKALFEAMGGGIPSGHVMNTVLFWFPLALLFKDRFWWWVYGGLVLLMAWSRMYAGVHYPQDVIAGLLFSGLILWVYYRIGFDPATIATPRWMVILTLFSIAMIPLAWSYKDGLTAIGAFGGMIWGLWIETRYVHAIIDGDPTRRLLRYIAGIVVVLALFFGLRLVFGSADPAAIFRVLRYGALTAFVIAGWPWAWQKIGL